MHEQVKTRKITMRSGGFRRLQPRLDLGMHLNLQSNLETLCA